MVDLDEQRARHEKIKADQRELKLAIERGEYLPRAVQQQAAAAALAVLTQSLRSIPDNLERTLSLEPRVVEAIAVGIDAALSEVATAFKAMTKDA
jgi:hypothetical protein